MYVDMLSGVESIGCMTIPLSHFCILQFWDILEAMNPDSLGEIKMSKTKNGEIPELELPDLATFTAKYKLPEVNEQGKVVLEKVPKLDLDTKRSTSGDTTFISLFSGSISDGKGGYDGVWERAGRIFLMNRDGKTFLTYLDLVALIDLIKEHSNFVAYQIMRRRADIKEEIHQKAQFLK